MEPAATLQKKKTSINKGQLKKTIKNILCRSDPQFWPIVSEDDSKVLDLELQKHKVECQVFIKPHWLKVKDLPKDERPRPPKKEKPKGFIFGISDCTNALHKGECSAIFLESTTNPRSIVQSITDFCVSKDVPYVCLNELRKKSATYFGIPTCCLGIDSSILPELTKALITIAKKFEPKSKVSKNVEPDSVSHVEMSELSTFVDKKQLNTKTPQIIECPYLYRTNKKSRVFVPSEIDSTTAKAKKFVGQDFIEFGKVTETNKRKMFKNMLLKRIGSNPDRKSGKKFKSKAKNK